MIQINIIRPSDFRFIRWVTLNTPMEVRTKDGMKINYKSVKIGKLCSYKKTGEIVYLTYRKYEPGVVSHFMVREHGFGIDCIFVEKFLTEYQKNMSFGIGKQNMKIVFEYDGVNEHRYYYITLDELKEMATEDGFSSDKGGYIQSWGLQKFIRKEFCGILGYAPEDIAVLHRKEQMSKWKKMVKAI